MTDSGKAVGMLFNPGFPDPVRQQYGDCSCRISATDWGVVRLHAIIINPVHPNTGSGRWSLNVRINDGRKQNKTSCNFFEISTLFTLHID